MFNSSFLQDVLLKQNYIHKEDATAAAAYEKAGTGTFLEYLLQKEIINRATLGLAVAEHYETTFTDLDTRTVSEKLLEQVPEQTAQEHRIIIVKEEDASVTVATDKVEEKQKITRALKKLFPSKKIIITYAFSDAVTKALSFYETALNTRFSEILKKEEGVAPELFQEIISDALLYRASDIHFEPREIKTNIRFRIDGTLRLAGSLPKDLYINLLNRIKIEAELRTDEHFRPQDGAIRFEYNQSIVDLRVSVVPTIDGEKVVVRVLTEYIKDLTFSELGFSEKHIQLLEKVQSKPFGMVIVTGPTGSGKTTTLYSFVKKVNRPEINITTIEDPVEYHMPGTNQIQVNRHTDVTFAKGLRSIVRQDPDVILLGEIRDIETAETAVNASLTGHMLLSTFHANNAASAIPRLLDMGVEPFLLASSLELVIAQRLIRRVCPSCRQSYSAKVSDLVAPIPALRKQFGKKKTITLYKGEGCSACNQTGFNGRVAVVEMIPIDKDIRELINQNPSADEIWQASSAGGAESMFADGLRKALVGTTTLDEVLRVTEPT